ncbi:hypothetical protein TrLO_g13628 [Triparma laevis f. longispina]|uniref:Uncharacterized protein n=1 Tax=Triparma laevis f. longispina TaxID=1714387 RepID=A0A9W7DZW1_9STRA|nr:hypothetical protein TrLO_g13628 [Triparma laevis f. longispina]
MSGGGVSMERLNIGINWVQTFGVVLAIEVALPKSLKEVFSFLNVFSFNLDAFEGMGEVVSIVMGLLVPAWLVLELDAGLFRERTYFGFWGMTRKNGNIIFFKGLIAGLILISVIAVSFVCIAEGWINNDLVNALLLVLSSLNFFSFLHQVYLLREVLICVEDAKENFAKKRQENSMFLFLFFYTVAYLSGVSACSKLLVAEAPTKKLVGGILLPSYVFVPLWRLRGGAASAKAAVREAASEEGHLYKEMIFGVRVGHYGKPEIKYVPETKVLGRGEVSTYKDSLGVFSKKAVESAAMVCRRCFWSGLVGERAMQTVVGYRRRRYRHLGEADYLRYVFRSCAN